MTHVCSKALWRLTMTKEDPWGGVPIYWDMYRLLMKDNTCSYCCEVVPEPLLTVQTLYDLGAR